MEIIYSFELGGEKKTKGAALTFVSLFFRLFLLGVIRRAEMVYLICSKLIVFDFLIITNMICNRLSSCNRELLLSGRDW